MKPQMKFQRIAVFTVLITAVLVFVYALGFITSLYNTLYYTLTDPRDHTYSEVEGTQFYYELQSNVTYEEVKTEVDGKIVKSTVKHKTVGYNDELVMLGIGLIVASLFMFITNTHTRRKYYCGNYISTGIIVVSFVGAAIWIAERTGYFLEKFLAVDFEALEKYCALWKYPYNDSTLCFDLGYALSGLLVLVAVVALANLIWKITLMRRENKLLNTKTAKEA